MNKYLFHTAFALGALSLVWVGSGFFGSQALALAMTLLIAAVYCFGAWELHGFRQRTQQLTAALQAIPANLAQLQDWLGQVPDALQQPVRLRIEGERVGLPGPALTPYLVGLLVMLGMLGTFLGMVATLNGAVFALEGTADVAAIRSAFAAPIKGLGLAFGTSVAGVASSAMLGLMSALSRRERLQAAQLLDRHMAGSLRGFSHSHQRQQAYLALQQQAQALPAVALQLQALMQQLEHSAQHSQAQLLARQDHFHGNVTTVYTALARSVEQSLHSSLAQSAQLAGDSLRPVLQSAMDGMAQEAGRMHAGLIASTQTQLDGLTERISRSAHSVAEGWTAALAQHQASSSQRNAALGQSLQAFNSGFAQRADALLLSVTTAHAGLQAEQAAADQQRLQAWRESLQAVATGMQAAWQTSSAAAEARASHTLADITRLLASSEQLVQARVATEAQWTAQHGQRMEQLSALLRRELGALQDAEAQRGDAAVARLGALQSEVAAHLAQLGQALEAPLTRLIETASEAPRAAAEVIGQLRQQVSASAARDNAVLEERGRILETLNTLLDGIHHAAGEQRAVIDTLVASAAATLGQAGGRFSDRMDAEAAKLAELAAELGGSAVEVASLGETFATALRSFGDGNDKLVASLQRVEGALDQSMARSDDQLAYYVAQARELIELSTGAQKDLVDTLQQLAARQAQREGAA